MYLQIKVFRGGGEAIEAANAFLASTNYTSIKEVTVSSSYAGNPDKYPDVTISIFYYVYVDTYIEAQ